jgi:rhodanese-related sulfurtransferase
MPLDRLNNYLEELPKNHTVYLHCAGGYRSMIAHSMLQARGWRNLVEVQGGYKAIAESLQETAHSKRILTTP